MSSICDKKDCTGCLACMNICAHGAIEKIYDEEGFISVNINYEKCVKCGLCKKVCPQLSSYKNINFKKIYYAAYSNNIDKLMSSTSGAIFQEIVDSMYKKFKKFIVVGAVLENNNVKHVAYEDYNEYYKLYGSKYVQSDIDNIYKYVKKKLEEDYYVLFSGTPCQIHALNKFLMKKYTKLYTVDLICHGVSNGILFSKYINFLEDKYRGKVTNYNFRTKDKKTWEHMCSFNINNKKVYIKGSLDPYLYNFLKGTILRNLVINANMLI